MRVGLVQTAPRFGEVQRNIDGVFSAIESVDAVLWILPELFATGYQFRDEQEVARFAETSDGPTIEALCRHAREHQIWFCGGFPERLGDAVYNSAFLISPQGLEATYRKVHLFDREKLLFAPGREGFSVHEVQGATVGMMVCFDWFFPESCRTLALRGAQLVLHPSNLVLPHCPEAMKTRALENRVFTFTANRVGTEARIPEGGLTYVGRSVAYSPKGERLCMLSSSEPDVAVVDIEPSRARDKGVTAQNDLFEDRRPGLYE